MNGFEEIKAEALSVDLWQHGNRDAVALLAFSDSRLGQLVASTAHGAWGQDTALSETRWRR